MQSTSKNRLGELQTLISKMPIEACVTILPEFGVRWREVSKAVRSARLPMNPTSVARILCRHVARTLPSEEVSEIVARLRLKSRRCFMQTIRPQDKCVLRTDGTVGLIVSNMILPTKDADEVTRKRTWHVIKLRKQMTDEPVNVLTRVLPSRVMQAIRNLKGFRNMEPEIHTVKLGDLIYISIQMVSQARFSSTLYVAAVPNEPVALASCIKTTLLNACVRGLGYNEFEDVCLNGQDVYSLLRIYNTNQNEQPDYLTEPPSCSMVPSITRNGIDFTCRAEIEQCAKGLVGSAPSLNQLTVTAERDFFDPDRLYKRMKMTIKLHSENIAQSLLSWAVKGAILPDSELFHIFHKIKSNKIDIVEE